MIEGKKGIFGSQKIKINNDLYLLTIRIYLLFHKKWQWPIVENLIYHD